MSDLLSLNPLRRTPINENNLVEHLIKGDESAYAFLVDLYYERLCIYARNLTRDRFESEDLVQNVIIKLWLHRNKINADISLKNYLYKSVYNEFVDFHRKHTAVTTLEMKYLEGLDSIYETKERRDTQGLKAIMEHAIEQLPNKCKETFLLSKRDGLTYNEIAEYQNISVNTVENHMAKAFTLLREKLKHKIHNFLFLLFGISKPVLLCKKL